MESVTQVIPLVKSLDLSRKSAVCPRCGRLTSLHQRVSRSIRHPHLLSPLLFLVTIGVYVCDGDHQPRSFRTPVPFAEPRKRYSRLAVAKARASVTEDLLPYARVPHRLERDFQLRPAISTVWDWHQQFAGAPQEPFFWKGSAEHFSGFLCLDETFSGPFTIITATDPESDFSLGHWVIETSPNRKHIRYFCNFLKNNGIVPAFLIHDDSSIYGPVFTEVWPDVVEYACTFHFLQGMGREALKAIAGYGQSLPAAPPPTSPELPPAAPPNPPLWEQIPLPGMGEVPPTPPVEPPLPTPKPAEPSKNHPKPPGKPAGKAANPRREEVRQSRYLLLKRPDRLSYRQAWTLMWLLAGHPFLDLLHRFLGELYACFSPLLTSREEALALWRALVKNPEYCLEPRLKDLLKKLEDPILMYLVFNHLDRKPRHATNNHVERQNRIFKKRQKSHYRLRSRGSIANTLQLEMKGPRRTAA